MWKENDYFRERLWDYGIPRDPKSNLQQKCWEVSSFVLPLSSLFTVDEGEGRGRGQSEGVPQTVHLVLDKRRMLL